MGLRKYWANIKNSISGTKMKSVSTDDRTRPVGNPHESGVKPKKGFIQRALGGLGRFVGNLAYWGFNATLLGPAISYYLATPEKPIWPFRENTNNSWVILQNFDGSEGRVQRPLTTNRFNRPFEKDAELSDETGERIANEVPAYDIERDFKNFDFLTREGYRATVEVQFVMNIPTEGDAKKSFYRLQNNYGLIDTQVLARVSNKLNSMTWEDVKKQSELENINYEKFVGGKITREEFEERNGKAFRHIIASLHDVRRKYGVNIVSISLNDYKLDERSQEIESTKIKAEKEREEAVIQQQATTDTLEKYLEMGKHYAEAEGDQSKAAYYAAMFWRGDNYQQMSKTGGAVVNIEGASAVQQSPIIIPADVFKPKEPKRNTDKA